MADIQTMLHVTSVAVGCVYALQLIILLLIIITWLSALVSTAIKKVCLTFTVVIILLGLML